MSEEKKPIICGVTKKLCLHQDYKGFDCFQKGCVNTEDMNPVSKIKKKEEGNGG